MRKGWIKFLVGMFVYAGILSYAVSGQATTLNVPGGYATIQAAIDAASGGDIVLVDNGIYTENINFNGKAITIRSANGAATTIIDGSNPYTPAFGSVVTFRSGEEVDSVLDGFTLTNGTGNATGPYPVGGGISCNFSSSPTITNCIIINNSARQGAGISCKNSSSPAISNCIISNNSASNSGGGIACSISSSPTVVNCTISGNSASISGGGIYACNFSTLTVVNNILWGDTMGGNPNEVYLDNNASIDITYSNIQGGWTGEGNIGADPLDNPLFVDVANGDYHLQLDSPCIDAGTSTGTPLDDVDGDNRPQGTSCDMGVDEFTGNVLLMDVDFISKFSDDFATDTTGDYTWRLHPSNPAGTGYSWNPAGYVYMDGTSSGCCWVPAKVEAEKTVNLPASGYAKIDFDLVGDGAGESRIIFQVKEDDDNMYMFKVTDDTYGGSGYTQGVTKISGGVTTDYYNGPGTVALGGSETGGNVDSINEHVVMEVWWSPTNLALAVNGTIIKNLITTDTTVLNPTSFIFKSYRLNTNWNSIEIYELSALDSSGNNNHADSSYMGTISYANGEPVFYYGGLKIPNSETLDVTGNEITLSIWAKPNWDETTTTYHCLFDKRSGSQGDNYNSYRFFFNRDIDAWRFRLTTESGTVNCDTPAVTVQPGVWQHLVARYDGVNQSIWIDGVKMVEYPQSGNILGNVHDLYIGEQTPGLWPFDGALDGITIWERALSDQEIIDLSTE